MNAPVPPPLEARAVAFSLASTLTAYPGADFAARLRTQALLLAEAGLADERTDAMLDPFRGALDDTRSDYIDTFDRTRGANPLYETSYGAGASLGKGNALSDISGFYRAFGLERADGAEAAEMLDHVAVELEFYAVLLLKQALLAEAGDDEGVQVVEDARRKFLEAHLGPLAGALGARGDLGSAGGYAAVVRWCSGVVADECRALGIPQRPLGAATAAPEPDEVRCDEGNVRLPVIPV